MKTNFRLAVSFRSKNVAGSINFQKLQTTSALEKLQLYTDPENAFCKARNRS